MPTRTFAQLHDTDLAPNGTGAIQATHIQNLLDTLEQIIKALNTTERGQIVLRAVSNQPGLTMMVAGTNGQGLIVRPESAFVGKQLLGVCNSPTDPAINWYVDGSGSMFGWMYWAQDPALLFGAHTPTEFGAHMHMTRADVNGCIEWLTVNVDGQYFNALERFDGYHLAHTNGDASYEMVRPGTGPVLTDETTSDSYRVKMVGGVLTPEKIGDYASTGSAASTPVHVTNLVTALGGAGNVTAIWARDARVTAVNGRATVWTEARDTAGRALNGVLAYVNPAGDPESGRLGLPRWDGTRFRFFNGQRMQTDNLAEFRAAAVRTIAVVGTFEAENPTDFWPAHIANIQDGSMDFGMLVRNNLIMTQMFDGSSLNWVSSGVAASRATRRCAILTRAPTEFTIQVAPSARVTTVLAEPAFAAATSRLMIGGIAGDYLTGSIDAVVALPIAASQAQADAIIAWAAAEYGSAS